MEAGAESQAEVNFAPGTRAPTVERRVATLNAGRDGWNSLPKEVRAARRAEKKAKREAKAAAKAEKQAARAAASAPPPDSGPDTVRSARQHSALPPAAPPASAAPAVASAPIEVPRVAALTGKLQGLVDLVAALPGLDEGTSYIQVSRLKPTVFQGTNCSGVLKPIKYGLDDAEFFQEYGGGEYVLRGYNYQEHGRPRPATETVHYKLPGAPLLVMPDDEDEDPQMRPTHQQNGTPPRRGFPATPQHAVADAQMHDRDLTHAETMDERNERRAREEREAKQAAAREARRAEVDRERLQIESREREQARIDAMHERELDLARNSGPNYADIAQLLKVARPGEETTALMGRHAQEIRAQADQHRDETARLIEQHRDEMRRLAEAHTVAMQRVEDHARSERERADNLVREAERRANEQMREAQRNADARVQDAQNLARSQYEDLRARGEERLRDNQTLSQQRLEDLRESHARELRQKESEITLMRTNLEGNQAVILQTKDNEIKRLQHELRLSKDEAEKNKDWVSKMKEAGETAEALGYVKPEDAGGDDGDGDLKTMAMKAGLQAVTQLPQLIQAGANAIAQVRNPGGVPERGGGRPGAVRGSSMIPRAVPRQLPPMQTGFTFATEGSNDYVPPVGTIPLQQAPMQASYVQQPLPMEMMPNPPAAPAQQVFDPQPMGYDAPPAAALPQPATAQQPPAPPSAPAPTQSMAPPPPPSAPSVPPPPAGGAPGPLSEAAAAIIANAAPGLQQAFEERHDPGEVAQGIAQSAGSAEMLQFALQQVTSTQLLAYFAAQSEHPALASRAGQKYLRSVWQQLEKIAAGTGAQ